MSVAVIDLGTNTFHLLIADDRFKIIYKEQFVIKLGEGSIQKNYISEPAYMRAMSALQAMRESMNAYQVKSYKAFGTSAIRGASNGEEFIKEAFEKYQIKIDAISGDDEAQYIYMGVSETVSLPKQNILVMDIGGGSVELIIGKDHHILWKKSFAIGAARLIGPYHSSDPITKSNLEQLRLYIQEQLLPLKRALQEFPTSIMVGAAGAFESLAEMNQMSIQENGSVSFPLESFQENYVKLISSTAEQRAEMPGLVSFRIEMMVVAIVLMDVVMQMQQTHKLYISSHSMKEGILQSLKK